MTIETPEQYQSALQRLEKLKAILVGPIASSGGLTDMAFYEWMKPISDEYGDLQFEIYYYLIGSSPELQELGQKNLLRYIYSRGYVYISGPDTGPFIQYDGNRLIALAAELLEMGRMLQPKPAPELDQLIEELKTIRMRMKT